ncbi:MAG: VOC family protein [Acidimicrobiia bacterium]
MDPKRQTIYPTLRYKDAPAAIKYLTDVLGLKADFVVEGPDDTIVHAQLAWENGLIMLGTAVEGVRGISSEIGGCCIYLAIDDPDARHDRAVKAGAEVVMGLTDQEYGSREFAVRDPEGNLWAFGTYQPFPGSH